MDKENYTPNFERQIKSKLNQLEANPRPVVWERIEAALDQKDNKTILIPFWNNAAVIAGGIVLGLSLMFLPSQDSPNIAYQSDSKLNESIQIAPDMGAANQSSNAAGTNQENSTNNSTTAISQEHLNTPSASSNYRGGQIKDEASQNAVAQNTIPNNPFSPENLIDRKAIKQKRMLQAQGNNIIPRTDEPIFVNRNNEIIALEVIGENKMAIQTKADVIDEEIKNPIFDLKSPKKQVALIKGFYAGVNGGANTSFIFYSENSTNPIFNQKSSILPGLGFTYGATFGYDFNNKIGLQTGFNYTRYNSNFTQPLNDYTFIGSMSIFQFDIPLIFKYKWNIGLGRNNNPLTIAALIGFRYSQLHHYYLQAKLQSNTVSNQFAKIEQDDKSYNRHQLGYLMGVEFKYFFKKNWSFHAAAISNIASDISQFPIFLNNTREKPIQLGLGSEVGIQYHFPVKKKKTTK